MQDDQIHWNGQPIAVVLAETQEQADHARSLIRATYEVEESAHLVRRGESACPTLSSFGGAPLTNEIGDAEAALAAAPLSVDLDYRTPYHNHNAIEPHAATLGWDGDDADRPRRHAGCDPHGVVARGRLRDRRGAGPCDIAVCRRRLRRQDDVAAPRLAAAASKLAGRPVGSRSRVRASTGSSEDVASPSSAWRSAQTPRGTSRR